MKLLEQDSVVEDRFVAVADDAPVPPDLPALIGLARLPAELHRARTAPLGVRVEAATPVAALFDALPRLALIAVVFTHFRDGRGFSLARALREQHGFAGDIRAVGHVLADQHAFLLRCGFSGVALADDADIGLWSAALGRFRRTYQVAVADPGARDHGEVARSLPVRS